jgi:serine/threonine protein kinase
MAAASTTGVVRFGPFEFDLATRELRKGGIRVRAPDQSLEILAMLLVQPARLVTREAIQERLWPNGTVVEFEHSVNAAVKRLREALRDSATNPRYIETLPKKGYRFVSPVESSSALPAIRNYRLLEEIGRGGMGIVYRAEDVRLGRQVAIKVLPPEFATDPQRRARLMREARAASALNHANIVTVYDIGSESGFDFIAMEFVAGKPLADLIPPMGLKAPEAVRLAVQIAGALAKAHSAGIAHRDLKPANVMLDAEGDAKLMDFGLAKTLEAPLAEGSGTHIVPACTAEGAVVGTAGYMSPEQAEGKPADHRSDIFSFGAMLYEMVTGRHAFERDSNLSTLAAILHDEPVPPRHLSPDVRPDLERVILRCLEKDPGARYGRMDDIATVLGEIRRALDTPPVLASKRLSVRRSWLLLAAAGAVAGTTAAIVYYASSTREKPAPDLAGMALTASGNAYSPSFSPDGNRIAFCWDGERQDNLDIYVRQIGSNAPPLRLTTDPAGDVTPVWSPDDRYIAFVRIAPGGRGSIFVVSPLGGREHRITDATVDANLSYDFRPLSWTPDSKWLAVALQAPDGQSSSIWLRPVESGEPRRLTTAPPGSFGDRYPSISPDGRTLVFARSLKDFVPSVWRLRLTPDLRPEGEPLRTFEMSSRIYGLAWTSDSREIIYSAGESPRLFRAPASGGRAPVPLAGSTGAMFPAINGARRRLAYVVPRSSSDLWRLDTRTGQRTRLLRFNGPIGQQQYSPDARRIAFATSRSGYTAIWTCDADGSGCAELASLGPAVGGSPRWSPDGRWIAADSRAEGQSDVYLIPAEGGAPRRLTTDSAEDFLPTWSRDGEWIYFGSKRSGRKEIWRMRATGAGAASQVTRAGGLIAFESPDRKYLYYLREVTPVRKIAGRNMCELLRMPMEGGQEQLVLPAVQDFDEVGITADAIFFSSDLKSIQRLSLSTGNVETVLNDFGRSSMGVSPDGAFILFATARSSSDLMLVEGFR